MNPRPRISLIFGFPLFIAALVSVVYFGASNESITVANPIECLATGCNGELCSDERIVNSCRFRPEFTCYKKGAVCEYQKDGKCGWTLTDELAECLDSKKRLMMNID